MPKKALLILALSSIAGTASAHQLWLERATGGTVRVYFGEAEVGPDRGEEVAKLATTTQVFTTDRTRHSKLTAREDHLDAGVVEAGDVRLINQGWEPWKTDEGKLKTVVFTAREGRKETRSMLEYELVPVASNGNAFTLTFKGQPLADKEVTVINPEKWTKSLKTNAQGRIEVPLKGSGRYILMADHDVAEARKVGNQTVAEVAYATTLSFVHP